MQAPNGLHPLKISLDSFPKMLTEGIALMPSGAPIQARGGETSDLGEGGADMLAAQGLDKLRGMVAFVATQGRRMNAITGLPNQLPLSGPSFYRAGGRLQP